MLKRSVISMGSILASTLGLVVAAQAQQANPGVQAAPSGCTVLGDYEVCTTDPAAYGEQDLTIVDRMIDYIKGTTSGRILGAMFLWVVSGAPKSQELIDEIINAESRGVDADLNYGSLRESSDGMLRVTNSGVFNVYADYYAYMWELSKAH